MPSPSLLQPPTAPARTDTATATDTAATAAVDSKVKSAPAAAPAPAPAVVQGQGQGQGQGRAQVDAAAASSGWFSSVPFFGSSAVTTAKEMTINEDNPIKIGAFRLFFRPVWKRAVFFKRFPPYFMNRPVWRAARPPGLCRAVKNPAPDQV